MMNTPNYSKKTIQRFLDYLSESGLSVYGPWMENEGNDDIGCMDYTADDIRLRRKVINRQEEA